MGRIFLLTVFLIVLCIECQPRKSMENIYADSEKIFNESLRIHDEVMPKMGEIIGLQTALRDRKKQMKDKETIDRINHVLQDLENAHNGMMQWMHNVPILPKNTDMSAGSENIPSAKEMRKIQEESLEQIKNVQMAILKSIQDANDLMTALP